MSSLSEAQRAAVLIQLNTGWDGGEMERAVNLFICWIMKKQITPGPLQCHCSFLLHCMFESILSALISKCDLFFCWPNKNVLSRTVFVSVCTSMYMCNFIVIIGGWNWHFCSSCTTCTTNPWRQLTVPSLSCICSAYQVVVEEERPRRARGTAEILRCYPVPIHFQNATLLNSQYYFTAQFPAAGIHSPQPFTVGDNKTYNGYWNAPLLPQKSYSIYYQAVSTANGVGVRLISVIH